MTEEHRSGVKKGHTGETKWQKKQNGGPLKTRGKVYLRGKGNQVGTFSNGKRSRRGKLGEGKKEMRARTRSGRVNMRGQKKEGSPKDKNGSRKEKNS